MEDDAVSEISANAKSPVRSIADDGTPSGRCYPGLRRIAPSGQLSGAGPDPKFLITSMKAPDQGIGRGRMPVEIRSDPPVLPDRRSLPQVVDASHAALPIGPLPAPRRTEHRVGALRLERDAATEAVASRLLSLGPQIGVSDREATGLLTAHDVTARVTPGVDDGAATATTRRGRTPAV